MMDHASDGIARLVTDYSIAYGAWEGARAKNDSLNAEVRDLRLEVRGLREAALRRVARIKSLQKDLDIERDGRRKYELKYKANLTKLDVMGGEMLYYRKRISDLEVVGKKRGEALERKIREATACVSTLVPYIEKGLGKELEFGPETILALSERRALEGILEVESRPKIKPEASDEDEIPESPPRLTNSPMADLPMIPTKRVSDLSGEIVPRKIDFD